MAPRPPSPDGARADAGTPESARKAVHVAASIAAAIIALRTPPATTPLLFVGLFLLAVAIDVFRRYNRVFGRVFEQAFGAMLRHRENHAITGATTLAAGFAITTLIVPTPYAAAGILVGGIGDAAAALVGRRWGRTRLPSGKSLEGSLACFAAGLPAAWAIPGVGLAAAALAAAVAAALELLPLPFDDNLWLAPAAGAIAWAAAAPLG